MPNAVSRVQELLQRRRDVKDQILKIEDFRPGFLVGRYRRCGRPTCHCAHDGEGGHGPSWSLTRAIGGKTVTRIIPPEAVEETQKQIAEYRRFRGLVRELVEANDQLCDARLKGLETASPVEAKKGASKKHSMRKSSLR